MSSVVDARPPDTTLSDHDASVAARVRRRWTVAEYHRMGEVGILHDDERMELIEGDIVEMAPIGSEHAGQLNYLVSVLGHGLHGKAVIAPQNPVILSETSEPQPDVAVLRWRDDYYRQHHPLPVDVLLMIEVGDSTVSADRHVKAPLYARHGIPEYWLVNLPERQLEIYRDPQNGQYRQVTEYRSGTVSPAVFPEVVIELAELFASR